MNKQPIDKAHDPDLRLSAPAMQRAALRAREIAARTGTAIVVSRGGVIEELRPPAPQPGDAVHEPAAPYAPKP